MRTPYRRATGVARVCASPRRGAPLALNIDGALHGYRFEEQGLTDKMNMAHWPGLNAPGCIFRSIYSNHIITRSA